MQSSCYSASSVFTFVLQPVLFSATRAALISILRLCTYDQQAFSSCLFFLLTKRHYLSICVLLFYFLPASFFFR